MLERKCWENEQYSMRECMEISGISQSIKQIDLDWAVLNVFDKIDAPVDLQNIEACHRLKSNDNGRSNKVIVKFSKRKDSSNGSSNEQKEVLKLRWYRSSPKHFIIH